MPFRLGLWEIGLILAVLVIILAIIGGIVYIIFRFIKKHRGTGF